MQLSILDLFCQPADSLELVQAADRLGFRRYWIGEHHTGVQCSNPLLLGSVLLGLTERIRIGSGAIGLSSRSPLSIVEDLELVRTLYGDRFDLGVSRGFAGTSPEIKSLLLDGRDEMALRGEFGSRLTYLRDHVRADPRPNPREPELEPAVWLLGTGEDAARLAGRSGVGFCSSFYHARSVDHLESALACYRDSFEPSDAFSKPRVSLVLSGLCTPTLGEAEAALSVVFRGTGAARVPIDEITDRPVGPWLLAGDGARCRTVLEAAAERFGPDELMIHHLTPIGPRSVELELRSLELLAAEFHLDLDNARAA